MLTNSIKLFTDFTIPTRITALGLNNTCENVCYLQLASNNNLIQISANNLQYNIHSEGYLTSAIINPTFILE